MDIIEKIEFNDYTATINLSKGGNCTSLENKKYNAFILREPPVSDEWDSPFLYGIPILFPVNRLSGGGFVFENRMYSFPINEQSTNCHMHGQLYNTLFKLRFKTKNMIVCQFYSNHQYLGFMHAFKIMITYQLTDTGLTQITEISNLSEINMPILLGYHTTFNTIFTKKSKPENIKIYADIFQEYERSEKTYLPTGNKPEFDEISQKLKNGTLSPFNILISKHYSAGKSGKMIIRDNEQKLKVVYENDHKFKFRLIFNNGESGYICLEPQTCLVNGPNSPFSLKETGFDYIKPNKSKKYISKIYIEPELFYPSLGS